MPRLETIWCVFVAVAVCEALLCYECNNARTDEECRRKGKIRLCEKNQRSCQTTERIDRAYGSTVKITKRCKQARACQNNHRQNKRKKFPQCKYFKKLSVCRCCCVEDLCNFNTGTCTGVLDPKFLKADLMMCPELPKLGRGRRICDNKNEPGSRCFFGCDKFYNMRGSAQITCMFDSVKSKAFWSEKIPCCSKPCPPHGNMDLVIGVDSSLESDEDWKKVQELLKSIIRSFIVGPSDSRIGIVTYNEKISGDNEIYLSSHNTTSSLINTVDLLQRHPGKSEGTRIGQLLDHVNRVSFTKNHGDREHVRDILIILTSGAPLKERLEPIVAAKLMRDNGIEVITIGVGRYVDLKQLRGTAGVKKRVVAIPGGIEKIGDTRFRDRIIELICGGSCTRL